MSTPAAMFLKHVANVIAERLDLRFGLLACILNLLLAGEEDEDVPLTLA